MPPLSFIFYLIVGSKSNQVAHPVSGMLREMLSTRMTKIPMLHSVNVTSHACVNMYVLHVQVQILSLTALA